VTPTAVTVATAVTAVTAARVLVPPARPGLAGPGPAAAVLAGPAFPGPVPVRTPTAVRVLAARVPVVRVRAR